MKKLLTLTVLILGILIFTSSWATAGPGPNILDTVWTGCDNPYVGWYEFDSTCVCLRVDYQQGSLFAGTLFTGVDGSESIYGNIEFKPGVPGVLTLNFVGTWSLRGTLSVPVAINGAFGQMKGSISRDFDWWGEFYIKFITPTLKFGGFGRCGDDD